MLKRPLTSIELTLDDIAEFEDKRQEMARQLKAGGSSKPYNEPPVFQQGPKSKQEIHNRIGLAASVPQAGRDYNLEH